MREKEGRKEKNDDDGDDDFAKGAKAFAGYKNRETFPNCRNIHQLQSNIQSIILYRDAPNASRNCVGLRLKSKKLSPLGRKKNRCYFLHFSSLRGEKKPPQKNCCR